MIDRNISSVMSNHCSPAFFLLNKIKNKAFNQFRTKLVLYNSCIIIFLIIFSANGYAQAIKTNQVDPFTNERTIETTLVSLKGGMSNGFGVSYYAINNNYFLSLIGYSSSDFNINETDKVWFVLEDGNVVQFNNRAEVEGGESDSKNIFIYHYYAKLSDIEILKNKSVAIVRIAKPYNQIVDFKLSKKGSKYFQKLNEVFFNEINK